MSEGYILNTLQTPALLRPVYESVRAGSASRDELRETTGLDADDIQQATAGLRYVRLLGQEDGEFYVVDPPWEAATPELTFRMAILYNLAQGCTPGDWGTQAVVLLNYQYLLQQDIQYFRSNDNILLDDINEWHRTEKNYVPTSQQGEIDLNEPKFVNWTRIVSYLGLVHKATGREYTVYPDPDLIAESIRLSVEDRGTDSRIEIEEYLNWLRANLLPVEQTGDGAIPAPLGRILYNLVRDSHIRLVEHGDAGAVSLAKTPKRDGIDSDANTIKVVSQ
jgi:hypothetical protein